MYRRDPDGWSFAGADTSHPGIRGTVSSLETVAVFRDRTAPKIKLFPMTGGRQPRLLASIHENGAGLSVSKLRFMLDGKTVISEWDTDAGILIGHLRSPVSPGTHQLLVEAPDRVGNVGRMPMTFTVR